MKNNTDTLPKLLFSNGLKYPDAVAVREKDFGIWNTYTWSECSKQVSYIGLALRELKVVQSDVIGIIGNNRARWVFAELGIQANRAISIGLYKDALENEIEYLIKYSKCKFIFAEDEEQVDKILSLGLSVNNLKYIIYDDPKGMRKYSDKRLMTYAKLFEIGREIFIKDPESYIKLIENTQASDTAILCPTSGTTDNPKLAEISHKSLIGHTKNYLLADPKDETDEYVSVLPLPWIMEQVYAVGKWLICRMKINFVENTETTMSDLREIGPTFLLLAPRSWEQIAADIRSRIMESTRIKRVLFFIFEKLATLSLKNGGRSYLADIFLYKSLRDSLGFSFLRSAATGGAALGPDTFQFFINMGVPLRQLYGQTELLGAYTIHKRDEVDFNSVGVPFKNVKIRIDNPDDQGVGEIVSHHSDMMTRYHGVKNNKDLGFDKDWVRTGDAGYIDKKGHLIVIDRIKDLAKTSAGISFSPQYIENKLKFSTYIGEAAIIGSKKDFLSAMICIRYSVVSKWAERQKIPFTTYSDLSGREEIYNLMNKEIEYVNNTLPEKQNIKRFVIMYKEFDADDGELTRTRKLRRGIISKRYSKIVNAIYNNKKAIDINTTIKFQDGSSQRINTKLKIYNTIL